MGFQSGMKAVLVGLAMFAGLVHSDEVWKITSLDWKPYSGAEMATQGNSIQKLRTILKKEGITLQVDFLPWTRARGTALSKDYIGFFPAWAEEVDKGFVASLPVDTSQIAFMKKVDTVVSFDTVDDLFKKYKVGYIRTYTYPKDITDAIAKYPNNADSAMTEDSLVKKLQGGRHPVAITDPQVMQYLAGKLGIDDIEVVKILTKKDLVIALRDDAENKPRIEKLKKILAGVVK